MSRTLYSVAAVVAGARAFYQIDGGKIVYPDWVDVNDVRVDPEEYPMIFRWPEEGPRCGATMITDQIALTAAHCVEEEWNRTDPRLTVRLADGQVYGIQEIRANECWDFGPRNNEYSSDIAIMIFDRPIANAVEGIHYLKMYDPETMGTEVGQEFMLAGWGTSGRIQSSGNEDHYDRRMQILHRGYNHIEQIRDNMLIYTMDRPSNGGLDLEVSGHQGDSGSGALIEVDGELYIAGVLSHGQIPVGIGTFGAYTRVGGYHLDWIEDNLNINRRVAADGCGASISEEEEIIDDNQSCRDINDRVNSCDIYERVPEFCGRLDSRNFVASERCCACGGGQRDSIEDDNDSGNDNDNDNGIDEEQEEDIEEEQEEEIEEEQDEQVEEEQEEEIEEEQDEQVEEEQDEQVEEEQDDDGQVVIDCSCECDPDDFTCWETCYMCLDEIFGTDEESQDEEQTAEPEGLDCEDVCDCDFEEMMCWEECHACLDPHFGDGEIIEDTMSLKQQEPKSVEQEGSKSVNGKKK